MQLQRKGGRKGLVEFLMDKVPLDEADLDAARRIQAEESIGFVKAIQRSCDTKTEDILDALSEYFSIPRMRTDRFLIDPMVVSEIPEDVARQYSVVALFKVENDLTVAIADPQDIRAVDAIRRLTKSRVNLVLADETSIGKAIDINYGEVDQLEDGLKEIDERILSSGQTSAGPEVADTDDARAAQEQGTILLVNLILTQAIRAGASDIHIEPGAKKLRVRFRTDGVLGEITEPPKELHPAISSRIKIMANLDIAEKRAPQDGRFQVSSVGKQMDVRVSTLPTIYGEKIVMRLLNTGQIQTDLASLGIPGGLLETFERWIGQPHGMILVTGPTGSGKTTTLYAALNRINSVTRNIVTVEDPVEYRLDIVNQVQVNPRANLTFATGLRSILRQDPDVIMVGEIRDRETAQMAIESALTGHLVFSTLHTNDAPAAPARLIDMGVEPFLVASSLLGVVAQRLVRRLCPQCKEAYDVPPDVVSQDPDLATLSQAQVWRAKGCSECGNAGYKGRIGIYEMMGATAEVKETILTRPSGDVIRKVAQEGGFRTMRQEGLELVRKGTSSIEELIRATMDAR